MKITFSAAFSDIYKQKYNLTIRTLRAVIEQPLEKQEFILNGLTLVFYTQEVNNEIILIVAKQEKEEIVVDMAYRVKKKLIEGATLRKPIFILQKLVERFGLTIVIGNFSGKLLFQETVSMDTVKPTDLIRIENPFNHSFYQSFYIMQKNNNTLVCALAYALDNDAYLVWLNS